MQIVRFVVVVETTKASKLRTQFSKLFFAPIAKEIFKGKEREGMQKNPNFYFKNN
jgi:hypothetical protein